MRLFCFALCLSVCTAFTQTACADLFQLYDPTKSDLPGDQGWVSAVPPPATETYTGSAVNLNTTASRDLRAGYASELLTTGGLQHPLIPVLDRHSGYTVSFDLQVISEAHNSRDDNGDGLYDRAGFSVISISEDLLGLELAFFEDRIWAYAAAGEGVNSKFTQAEGVDFNTTAAFTRYDLAIQGDSYRLWADGDEVLTGSLRNYNPSGLNPLIDPYDNPSLLFFGDDTSSADSEVLIGSIEVLTVPEPNHTILLLGAALSLVVFGALKRRRAMC